jgi:ubiquinone biosynthesis protein UbiJ
MSPDTINGTAREVTAEQPEAAPEPEPTTVQSAILVTKHVEDNGDISVNVALQGDEIVATEVQTLLELAVPTWRNKIGLK